MSGPGRITGLTLWKVPLTSHETYYMAGGKTCATVDSMVLRVTTDQGLEGWGEVCPIPHYLPAYADGVAPALAEMAPVLLGQQIDGPEAMIARASAWLQGHVYAKSVLDIALWDLMGKAAGLPVHALLGGRQTLDLPLYYSLTSVAPEAMAATARAKKAEGYGQFQVKLGADGDWTTDVDRLRAVREGVGRGPVVYGDWNNGSDRLTAIRVGRAVRDLDIMLEQPCASTEACAEVRRATGLPMKLDEGAHDLNSLMTAQALGAADAVALKLSKFGGISAMRKARDLCVQFGIQMCIEDTWGSDIATAAWLHLASATPRGSILNTWNGAQYVGPRLDPNGPEPEGGTIRAPDAPGLGVTPDMSVLGAPVLELG